MTKTKKARLRAAKKELRNELRRLLDKRGAIDRWSERQSESELNGGNPNPPECDPRA